MSLSRNIKSFLLLTFVVTINYSCDKEDEFQHINENVVIVYMVANNNLYKNALSDINEMELAWNSNLDGKLIVVLEPKSDEKKIHLIEIKNDSDIKLVSSPTIGVYKEKDAVNPQDMNFIINDVILRYPSKRYSLILWSHATGWLPPNAISRSFGESNDIQMDIQDLAQNIPNKLFDILIFDACHMASIEVLYEMEQKANYIIASPSEILAQGFPYVTVVPLLFKKNTEAISIGKAFFNHYEQQTGIARSATIGVVKTSELKSLAQITKKIICAYGTSQTIFDNCANIQCYDRNKNKLFYDFKQTIECLKSNHDSIFHSFNTQFDKTILYSAHTDTFLGEFEIKECSGISCFIPNEKHDYITKSYYKTFSWYSESGFNLIFPMNRIINGIGNTTFN